MKLTYMLVALLSLASLIGNANAQSYVPRVSPSTSCSSGQFVTFGNSDVNQLSNTATSATSAANYIYARQFNVTSSGIVINQLSLGLLDNLNIQSMVRLRLGLFQMVGSTMVLLSQTEEILLYPTSSVIVYGNLLTSVTLNIDTYYVGSWFSTSLVTGVDTVIAGQHNRASSTYNPSAFPSYVAVGTSAGSLALQAHGCAMSDPFTASNTQVHKFCLSLQSSTPAQSSESATSTATTTHSFTGTIAVSTVNTGVDSQGQWSQITAGFAELVIATGGALSASISTFRFQRSMVLGGSLSSAFNQRFYTTGVAKVGDVGVSFTSSVPGNGDQYIISYRNGVYHLDNISPGEIAAHDAVVSVFNSALVSSVDAAGPVCTLPAEAPAQDALNCPSGSAEIKFGDDDVNDARAIDSTAAAILPANVMSFRVFTATSPNIQLKQLSMVVDANPSFIINLRLGLFTNVRSTYQLVEQTREITLINSPSTVIQANLLNPVSLQFGQNYSIAVISDQAIYAPGATFLSAPTHVSLTYSDVMKSVGFPSSVVASTTGQLPFVGASGCVAQQSTLVYSFCASFVYDTYTNVYSGTLTTLSEPLVDSYLGQYRLVVSGSGTATKTFSNGTSTSAAFSVRSLNLPSNNRLYVSGTPLDQFGVQFVITSSPGYATQLYSFYDANSGTREFRENQQTATSASANLLKNIVSSFSQQAHSGGSVPQCQPLPRPANIVVPASVSRVVCANLENKIIETYGDYEVALFSQRADGTSIAANRVYTFPFTPANSAVIRQLAVGLLNNMDKVGEIRVRLGLYAAANNSLLVQTSELRLNEAIDQVVIMDVPYSVSVIAGQSYYIAIFSSSILEVATTDSAATTSPYMTATYDSAGMPSSFTQTGVDVTPSIGAIACVPSTHSFCGYFQYATLESSVTLMYQGLLQASEQSESDSYGSFLSVMAVGGRLTTYSRGAFAAQTVTVYSLWQRSDAVGKLYTTSSNNMPLNSVGLQLEFEGRFQSTLLFNQSLNKLDDSFSGMENLESSLIYSGFSFTSLSDSADIPACGLSVVPPSDPVQVAPLSCPSGNTLIGYGDADIGDLIYSSGLLTAVRNTMILRPFLSHPTSASLLSQISMGININQNTINNVRLGLYSQNFTLLAGSNDINMINPHDQIFTAVLKDPVYLTPNTRYYLAMHTEKTIYTGMTRVVVPSAVVDFGTGWPTTFVESGTDAQRAVAGWACSTDIRPVSGFASTSSKTGSLSDGAVAGLVIGLVIGTNLLMLIGLYVCCWGGLSKHSKLESKQMEMETESRIESSQVEMNSV